MRSTILFFFTVLLLLGLSCKNPVDVEACDSYFSAGAVAQPFVHETYPGYKMARFSDDSELTIFCMKEKRNKSQIVRYKVEKGRTKIMHEQKDQIQIFDYNASGDMAFIHDRKLYILAEGESNPVEVPFSGEIGFVKWNGNKLICQIDQGVLIELDQEGNTSNQWNLLTRAIDYWARDSILLIANIDSITAYQLPNLTYQWSFQTHSYFEDLGTVVFISGNSISVAGQYNSANGLTSVVFSTPNQIYAYDIQSQEIESLWEQTECYVVEPGLSISPDGNQIVATISTMYSIVRKQFGLILLDMEGNWEVLEL